MNKISGTVAVNGSPANEGRYKATETANRAAPDVQSAGTEKDDLVLTDTARLLANAKKTQESFPDVDAAKIARIKQAIQQQGYHISAERIARKMVALEQL